MGRLRVLLVTGAYFPEISAGGLQSRAIAALLAPFADFQVLTTSTQQALPPTAIVDGVDVSRVYVNVGSHWSRVSASLQLLIRLLKLIPRVDLVHVHGYSSKNIFIAGVAKMFGRPVIVHLHTARHDEPAAIAAQGRLAWWAFRSADLYISVSPGLAQTYLAAGLPESLLRVVPNGVDAVRFTPATREEKLAIRRSLGLPLERPLVMFVGVLSNDKQPHVLFEAWRGLQHDAATTTTLLLIGSSSPAHFEADAGLADRIREQAIAAGISDRLVVVAPTNQIHDYFRAADIYVMPSLREGLPIALLEAMACGLPCVASNLPGSTDAIIDHGVNGWLAPVGDVPAFARALAHVIANPAEGARAGAAARKTVEQRYTLQQVAEHWLAAYRSSGGRP